MSPRPAVPTGSILQNWRNASYDRLFQICALRPARGRRGARPDQRQRRGVHQHPHRRHRRRLLSARRRDVENLRREDHRRQAVGAIDQGLGREPQSAASRARAKSPSRSATRSPTPGRATPKSASRPSSTSCARVAAIYPNYIQIAALKDARHQDARRSQGQAAVGRRAEVGHRTQRARDPRRRRHDLQGSRQGRISAVQRIGRTDEEPPARRDADLGRSRRVGDPRPVRLGRLRHRRDAEVGGGQDRARPISRRRSRAAPTRATTRT